MLSPETSPVCVGNPGQWVFKKAKLKVKYDSTVTGLIVKHMHSKDRRRFMLKCMNIQINKVIIPDMGPKHSD